MRDREREGKDEEDIIRFRLHCIAFLFCMLRLIVSAYCTSSVQRLLSRELSFENLATK